MDEHIDRLRRLSEAARQSQDVYDDDRETRDAAIEQAAQADMSTREIARWTRLAPATVHHIIVTRTAARQARLARQAGL